MSRRTADVVVIGGGIVGASCAWFLAQRGVDVMLIDKGQIGAEQSSRAWGFVRQQGRDPAEMPLMVACNRLWQDLPAMLGAEIEWVQQGNLAVAGDEERMEQFRGWLPVAKEFGVDTKILDREQVLSLIPQMQGPYVGGTFTPSDGHSEPVLVTRAIADAARRAGATVRTYCTATGLEAAGGNMTGVVTDQGLIRTRTVICAAGLHSSRLVRTVGLALPQIAIRATVAESDRAPNITDIGAWAPQASFRQRRSTGTFYIARGAVSDHDVNLDSIRFARHYLPNYVRNRKLFKMRIGRELIADAFRSLPGSPGRKNRFRHTVDREPRPNQDTARRSLEGLKSLFPALESIGIRRTWAGLIDSTPDAVPVVGEVDYLRGLILATGFSGHGFAMGPIVGKLMAELIVDGAPSIDLREMRFGRFAEGDLAAPRNVL